MPQTSVAEASTADTSATTDVTSTPTAATESDHTGIGTIPYLVGLSLLVLGALILFALSGSTIYRRLQDRTKRRGPRGFGQGSADGVPYVTTKSLDADDDNLSQLRDLLGRLKHDAQPQSEDAVPQLYSGRP